MAGAAEMQVKRYVPSDFEPLVEAMPPPFANGVHGAVGPVIVDPSRGLSPKFADMLQVRRFKRTWERTRQDLHDTSASGYDMALADATVRAGWSDQEIADLLVASRGKHGDDLKRPDYYQRTIEKARANDDTLRPEQLEELRSTGDFIDSIDPADHDRLEDAKKKLLAKVSQYVGFSVIRMIRLLGETPIFQMELPSGVFTLGPVQNLTTQRLFQRTVGAHTKELPKWRQNGWQEIARAMLKACEDVSLGELNSDKDTCAAWLDEYLLDSPTLRTPDKATIKSREPFLFNGKTAIFLSHFAEWILTCKHVNLSPPKLGKMLHDASAEPDHLNLTVGKKHTTRAIWVLKNSPISQGKNSDDDVQEKVENS